MRRRLVSMLLMLACCSSGKGALAKESPIKVELLTANEGGMVAPGREGELALLLVNGSQTEQEAELSAKVEAFDGSVEQLAQHVKLAPSAKQKLAIPLGAKRFGHRTVHYELTTSAGRVSGSQSFVYARPAGAGADPAGFLFGVCGHLNHDSMDEVETQLQAVEQIGIHVVRLGREWGALEKRRGVWDFKSLDERVAAIHRHGLQMQMLLAYGNLYAAKPEAKTAAELAKRAGERNPWNKAIRDAPLDEPWRNFVRTVVTRYHDRIKLWEIWNEPDTTVFFVGSTDEYIRMLRSAYAEVKRVDKTARVMTAGFASVTENKYRNLNPDLEERVAAEASDAFDIFAHHEHGTFKAFRESVDGELARIRKRMKHPRPLYFNETGMSSKNGREREQALTLVKKITYARARGAIAYNWYDIRNDGDDPRELEHNFGLFTRDMQPKPAYATYNELIARMRGTKYAAELPLGQGKYGFVFDAPGRKLIVLWAEGSAIGQPVSIAVERAAGVQRIDLMGNAQPVASKAGAVSVTLQDEPIYLEFRGEPAAAAAARGAAAH